MRIFWTCLIIALSSALVFGQELDDSNDWPKVIESDAGVATIYQPQYDSLVGDRLYCMAAVSFAEPEKTPVFGAMWFVASLAIDRDTRRASVDAINIFEARFPEDVEFDFTLEQASSFLTQEVPNWRMEFSMEEIITSLEAANKYVNEGFNDAPPEIIYRTTPSVLVMIDGDPKWDQVTKDVERVVNTPALILKYQRGYYILGNGRWYTSSTTTEWVELDTPPKAVRKALDEMLTDEAKAELKDAESQESVDIIVRTTPAELMQTDGEADMVPISGTNLLYVTNSESDILFDINRQQYYALLSGRWFVNDDLEGDWSFLPPTELPKDFAKIPEGNEKDGVLSNVPGTSANKEARMDAQVPQTAAIDRATATTEVQYDGKPEFESIEETNLQQAKNSDKQVIKDNGRFYCVDDGIWYEAETPDGPWFASTKRPAGVDNIPASSSAYNVKYVYIYDVTPSYVYCGYLPAYTGSYIYYGVPVYGTGWYYQPWYSRYYYPRPYTWGFSMSYNPWYGFSMGMHYSIGGPYFNFGIHFGAGGYRPGYGGWYGGYFGCGGYRPPYRPPYGGWYGGRRPVVINNNSINVNRNVVNNINSNNRLGNMYDNNSWGGRPSTRDVKGRDKAATRPGVAKTGTRPATMNPSTRPGTSRPIPQKPSDLSRPGGGERPTTRPSTRPSTGGTSPSIDKGNLPATRPTKPTQTPATRPSQPKKDPKVPSARDNMYSDNRGNLYKRDQGNWQQTRPSTNPSTRPSTRPSTQPSTRPSTQPSQSRPGNYNGRDLNRDMQSRQRANQRSNNYQSRPSTRSAPRSSGSRGGAKRGRG